MSEKQLWVLNDCIKICDLLEIPYERISEYFYQ